MFVLMLLLGLVLFSTHIAPANSAAITLTTHK
jgi:hypothetical protein